MPHITTALRRAVPAVAVAAVLVLAGCSAGGSSGGSSGSSKQDLSKFQTIVDNAKKPSTAWEGPTSTPTPPKNINIALVTCAGAVAGCVLPAQAAADAAKALGWTATLYDGQGDPVTQNKVVTQAINGGANAVILAGVDPSQIGSALDLAKQKNVPVGSITQGVAPGNGIAYDIGANYETSGEIMGSWIITDSKGSAVVLPTNDKEFASTNTIVTSAIDTVKKCNDCKLKAVEVFVGSNIGNGLGQRIASSLQRTPDVNYVIGAFDPAVSDMVPAIDQVGIGDRVKIISNVGLTQNLQFIEKGDVQAADIVYDNTYEGYAAIDQMIRLLNNQPLFKSTKETDPRYLYGENVPQHLTTKDNLTDPTKPWTADNDAVNKFRALWGLS
jgi:ribose transport system substrate-binding protein